MFRKSARALSLLAVLFIACLTLLAGSVTVHASTGISAIDVYNFDCSNFTFRVTQSAPGNWAAIRLWIGSSSGTPILDSFHYGYPGGYWPLSLSGNGSQIITEAWAAQPNGTTLVARIYRALDPGPGSWDGGNYVDTTIQCAYGIHHEQAYLTCGAGVYHLTLNGAYASPTGGYAAVRIWANNNPIVDSYVAGYPSAYIPVDTSGNFPSSTVNFSPEQAGTVITARVYHALNAAPGSWDGGTYYDVPQITCQPQTITATPTATFTPTPTATP